MNLTDAHITGINQWLRKEHPEAHRHFLDDFDSDWVLYGTGTAQLVYLAVMDAAATAIMSRSNHVTRDQIMGRHAVHSGHKELHPSVSNYWIQFNADTVGVDRTGDRANPVRLAGGPFPTAASGAFFERFNASPQSLGGASYAKLVGGMKKHDRDAPDRPKLREATTVSMLRSYAVRRACKFLMYDSIRQRKAIRYVIDDLNLEMAAASARVDGKVPVCTSELREVFRFWDYFEPHVDFYKEFTNVRPPWEASTANADTLRRWGMYAGHRANKTLSGNIAALSTSVVDLLRECVDAATAGRARDAIALYHESRPSRYAVRNEVNLEGATL
jgi:hypothetical protein